jgi:hypothetical protein
MPCTCIIYGRVNCAARRRECRIIYNVTSPFLILRRYNIILYFRLRAKEIRFLNTKVFFAFFSLPYYCVCGREKKIILRLIMNPYPRIYIVVIVVIVVVVVVVVVVLYYSMRDGDHLDFRLPKFQNIL